MRKAFCWFSILAAAACLAAGSSWLGAWGAIAACLLHLGIWTAAIRRRSDRLRIAGIVLSTGLFAAEALAGSPAWTWLPGLAFALAGLDLAELDRLLAGSPVFGDGRLLERRHAGALVLALGLGLGAAGTAMAIHLNIPFGGMVPLVLVVFYCLEQVRRSWMS